MKFSIVIATFNEGRDLEATVAQAWASHPHPHEVIVVDDCSDEDVAKRLNGSFPEVKVVRTPERLGAGPAKRFGGMLATGDVIVLSDSHMRYPWDWLETAERSIATYPKAIWCCVTRGFEKGGQFCGAGASISWDKIGMEFKWLEPSIPEVADHVPLVLGGLYFIPRAIWDDLDGLNPCFHGWGYEEVDLSVRSWLCGWEVRRMNNLTVKHQFKREMKGDFLNAWHSGYNSMVCHATLFDHGVWESIKPFMFRMLGEENEGKAVEHFIENEDAIMSFRARVQAKRKFTDAEIVPFTKFAPPTADLMKQLMTARQKDQAEHRWKHYEEVKKANAARIEAEQKAIQERAKQEEIGV